MTSKVTKEDLAATFGNVEESYFKQRPPLIEGVYPQQVVKAEKKVGDKGSFVVGTATISEGEQEGRFVNLKMFLSSPKALAITKATLSVIFDGKIPAKVLKANTEDSDALADVIVDVLNDGPEFKGWVALVNDNRGQKDEQGNPYPPRATLIAKK